MSWSISSSKSLLFVRSDNIVQGPRSLVIQSSFADQFVLISLQEIEHEKKKENGDLFFLSPTVCILLLLPYPQRMKGMATGLG